MILITGEKVLTEIITWRRNNSPNNSSANTYFLVFGEPGLEPFTSHGTRLIFRVKFFTFILTRSTISSANAHYHVTRVVKWIAKIAIIAKLRIAIAKKHNFANNTIQFFECRSQSQHNTIWFSRRSQLRKLRKLLYWRIVSWKIGQTKLDSRSPEFFIFKFHIWVKIKQKGYPWHQN